MNAILLIVGYFIGFLICLFILHKFKRQLDIDNTIMEKFGQYREDYDSNAEAYTGQ